VILRGEDLGVIGLERGFSLVLLILAEAEETVYIRGAVRAVLPLASSNACTLTPLLTSVVAIGKPPSMDSESAEKRRIAVGGPVPRVLRPPP
jgi:hypothetical protein